jgi:hypothetical protein
MIKVRILDRCEFCDGEAYVFVCEDVDANEFAESARDGII